MSNANAFEASAAAVPRSPSAAAAERTRRDKWQDEGDGEEEQRAFNIENAVGWPGAARHRSTARRKGSSGEMVGEDVSEAAI